MKSLFYVNGKLKGEKPPSWFTHLGVGVFDTMRVRKLTASKGDKCKLSIFGWEGHMERLISGATTIGCAVPSDTEIMNTLNDACLSFDWSTCKNARLRIIVLLHDFIVTLEPWQKTLNNKKGIDTILYYGERSLPEIKSCSAIVSAMARKELEGSNAKEAFLVDREGILREGSWSNFFWIDSNGTLVTPATKILKGVTRSVVLNIASEFMDVREEDAHVDKILLEAKEAFMTQTSHGIVPVVSIEGTKIGNGSAGEYTAKLISRYNSFVEQSKEPFTLFISL